MTSESAETPSTAGETSDEKPRYVACHLFEISSEPPEADIYVKLPLLGWYPLGRTGPDAPVRWYCRENIEWDSEHSSWQMKEGFDFCGLYEGSVRVTLGALIPGYGQGTLHVTRPPSAFQHFSGSPETLAAEGKVDKCPEASPENSSSLTISVFPTMKYPIAWHYLKVDSDPPGAHIYSADDNHYWGETGPAKPVFVFLALPLKWDAKTGSWTWADPHFVNGCYEATVIARRKNYSDAQQKLKIRSSDFHCFTEPPEELTAQGKVGMSDPPDPSNTTIMMMVLQPGAGEVI